MLDQVPSLNARMNRRTRARPCSSSHCLIASSVMVQGLVQEVILSAVEQSAVAMCYMREDLRHDKVSASRAPSLRHTNTAVTSCAIPLSSLASHSHRLALPPRTSLAEHGGGGGCAQRSRPCSRRAGAPSFPPFVLHNVLVPKTGCCLRTRAYAPWRWQHVRVRVHMRMRAGTFGMCAGSARARACECVHLWMHV